MRHLPSDITFHHLRFDPDQLERWVALLSPEEAKRAAEFPRTKRREEFVLGRAAARLMLAERIGTNPVDVGLEVAEGGAVDVVGMDLHISIAHSGSHAIAAAAPRMLGVDIEGIRARHAGLADFMLHPDEHGLIDAMPLDTERSHILCWTLKEATLKAMRTGLRVSPKKLRLDVDLASERATVHVDGHVDSNVDCGATWTAYFEEWDGYYVAIAFEEGRPS
ncbi:MAG: 4'-phosphopantetheinyl transferase superfamily protein [Rhodothermales bacterium]